MNIQLTIPATVTVPVPETQGLRIHVEEPTTPAKVAPAPVPVARPHYPRFMHLPDTGDVLLQFEKRYSVVVQAGSLYRKSELVKALPESAKPCAAEHVFESLDTDSYPKHMQLRSNPAYVVLFIAPACGYLVNGRAIKSGRLFHPGRDMTLYKDCRRNSARTRFNSEAGDAGKATCTFTQPTEELVPILELDSTAPASYNEARRILNAHMVWAHVADFWVVLKNRLTRELGPVSKARLDELIAAHMESLEYPYFARHKSKAGVEAVFFSKTVALVRHTTDLGGLSYWHSDSTVVPEDFHKDDRVKEIDFRSSAIGGIFVWGLATGQTGYKYLLSLGGNDRCWAQDALLGDYKGTLVDSHIPWNYTCLRQGLMTVRMTGV